MELLVCLSVMLTVATAQLDINNYNNTCDEPSNATTHTCEPCQEFDSVMRSCMLFACMGDAEAAQETVQLAAVYMSKWRTSWNQSLLASVRSVDLVRQFTLLYSNATLYRIRVEELLNKTATDNRELDIYDLETTLPRVVARTQRVVHELTELTYTVRALKNITSKYGLSHIFLTPLYEGDILNDTKYMEYRDEVNSTIPRFGLVRDVHTLIFKVWPAATGVLFLLGILGNGLLLLIFARHSEMRTVHNVMLVNLVVTDMVSLLINLPLTYAVSYRAWGFNLAACQCMLFLKTLTVGVSTYCVVVISYQRFRAVSKFSTSRATRFSSALVALALWLAAILYSVPAFFLGTTYNQFCRYDDDAFPHYSNVEFLLMCIIPTILIGVFSILVSRRLKESADKIPGERMGQEKRIRERVVTSRVLIGLVFVFVLSYLPKYLFNVLIMFNSKVRSAYLDVQDDNWITYVTLSTVVEHSLFLNPVLNPVVLYFLSSKFRKYFNNYLLCRCSKQLD